VSYYRACASHTTVLIERSLVEFRIRIATVKAAVYVTLPTVNVSRAPVTAVANLSVINTLALGAAVVSLLLHPLGRLADKSLVQDAARDSVLLRAADIYRVPVRVLIPLCGRRRPVAGRYRWARCPGNPRVAGASGAIWGAQRLVPEVTHC
jgi:hypothetical protein